MEKIFKIKYDEKLGEITVVYLKSLLKNNLSVPEFLLGITELPDEKERRNMENKKACDDNYDIKVLTDENENLIQPIYIGIQKITQLGIYEVYGKKWWVIKAPNKPDEKENKLIGEFNAKVWAEEFNMMLVRKGIQPLDPDLLIGWFANAIMAGYDKTKPTPPEPIRIEKIDFGNEPCIVIPQPIIIANKINEIISKLARCHCTGGKREYHNGICKICNLPAEED